MRVFFWQYCNVNDCARQWVFFFITLIVFAFTLYSVINTYRYHKRFIFQILPLTVNCLATGLILLLQIFEKGFEYHLATYLIEIYTYFLFCYTFTAMYVRVRNGSKLRNFKKTANSIFVIFSIIILILLIFVFMKTIKPACQKPFTVAYYIFFIIEGLLYIITLFFGVRILRAMNLTQQQLKVKLMKPQQNFEQKLMEDQYIKQRKKQITIVIFSYSSTIILRILAIILNNIFSSKIKCTFIDNAFINGSDNFLGQSIIIINSIIELIPHILLPIAMYIIPATKNSFVLSMEQQMLDQIGEVEAQQIDFNKEQLLRSKLSSLILTQN